MGHQAEDVARLVADAGDVVLRAVRVLPGGVAEHDVDAQLAAQRVGDAELLWHRDRDLKGVDAVIVPGGFSYGDYLRAGAIARFAPVMESVIEFAHEGGLVLGICNGFQILCEAGLLPGALLINDHLKFVFRQVELDVQDAAQLPSMCERLLTNPLIEDYEIVEGIAPHP